MNSLSSQGSLLIVEDDPNLGETLMEFLSKKFPHVHKAVNTKNAREIFINHPEISLVLMDIGLPDGDGLELAREFRAQRKGLVLLFLSALNDPETRVQGLELGAQDYITKPFDLKELTLRLERIFKQQKNTENLPNEIQLGKLKIWFNRFELQDAQGKIINLSQKECHILRLLYLHRNQVLHRDQILQEVWGDQIYPSNRTVDNYMVKLRRWCESDPTDQVKISSLRSVGYRLEIKEN